MTEDDEKFLKETMIKFNKKSINQFILDENNNAIPASVTEWSNFFENTKQRIVEQEKIGQYFVSTVFIGINHGYYYEDDKDYKPLIFETMVFDSMKDKSREEYCSQYSTWKEAEEGHARAVQWVLDGCKKEDDE